MIKLLIIFTICATTLFIVSCENTPDTDEFTITYYVDGLKVNLNPSTYSKGDTVIMILQVDQMRFLVVAI